MALDNNVDAGPGRWVFGLSVGALASVLLATVQVSVNVATKKDLSDSEDRVNQDIAEIRDELTRRERLAFREDDWARERKRIDSEHHGFEVSLDQIRDAWMRRFRNSLPED